MGRSHEQLEQAIAWIEAMLAAQAGDEANVIEAKAVIPSLPAPGSGAVRSLTPRECSTFISFGTNIAQTFK